MGQDGEQFRPTTITAPMVLVGTLIGSAVCLSNIHFGLQFGYMSTMPMGVTLLSFGILQRCSKWLGHIFTPTENIVVQAFACSIAGMSVGAGLITTIPAIEFLRKPEEGGGLSLSILQLSVFGFGTALFGTAFASPWRTYYILRERLRFPSAFASAALAGTLHGDIRSTRNCELDKRGLTIYDGPAVTSGGEEEERMPREGDSITEPDGPAEQPVPGESARGLVIISKAGAGTLVYLIVSYFVPWMTKIPVFGTTAARDWFCYLRPSPAFTAAGTLVALRTNFSMMLGAAVGWGALSPVIKTRGWAPGPVEDIETGARGLLVWIAIGLVTGDALVRAALMLLEFILRCLKSRRTARPSAAAGGEDGFRRPLLAYESPPELAPASVSVPGDHEDGNFSDKAILAWILATSCLCVFCSRMAWGGELPVLLAVAGLALTFPISFMVMQAAGETDTTMAMGFGNASQFALVLLASKSAKARLVTLIAGTITESGIWQSSSRMGDLKSAYLVQASPKAVFHAQILGSSLGSVIGACLYRLEVAIYPIPSNEFPIPFSHIWANTARMAGGGGVPESLGPCLIAAFAVAACLRILAVVGAGRRWGVLVPSGGAMAVGMYNPPWMTLAGFIGGLTRLCLRKRGVSEVSILAAATGCMLTEGTLSFVPAIMEALKIPHF